MHRTIAVEAQAVATRSTTCAAARCDSPSPPTSAELISPRSPARPKASSAARGNAPARSTSAAAGATVPATISSTARRSNAFARGFTSLMFSSRAEPRGRPTRGRVIPATPGLAAGGRIGTGGAAHARQRFRPRELVECVRGAPGRPRTKEGLGGGPRAFSVVSQNLRPLRDASSILRHHVPHTFEVIVDGRPPVGNRRSRRYYIHAPKSDKVGTPPPASHLTAYTNSRQKQRPVLGRNAA